MKRKFLLPALVVLLGIGSVVASHRLTPEFFPVNDSDCSGQDIPQPCTIGNNTVCTDDEDQLYYYIPDTQAEELVCLQLKRP